MNNVLVFQDLTLSTPLAENDIGNVFAYSNEP